MTLREQALSGFRWNASARLASQMITWAITLIVIRLLTPEDYGLLAMSTVFVLFFSAFSEFGLGAAVIQKSEVDESLLRRVFGTTLVIHFSLAALLMLAAPLIASFYDEPRVTAIIRVLSLQFILTAFVVMPDTQLQRRMEFRRRSLLDLSATIISSLATLTMALAGWGVWALVLGTLISQVWKAIGLNWLAPFLHWPEFSLQGTRSLLRFGGQVTASQVLWLFFSQVDTIICGKWLGKEALGFYSVAMHIASLPTQRVLGIINQVAFPTFSRMQDNVRKVGENVLLGIRILSFFAFPLMWGISSTAQEIVEVILGAKWTPSAIPLQVLGLIMPLRMIANFVPAAVQGMGRSDILLRNAIWASVILPLAFLIGVNWGLLGISLAWLVASPLMFLQSMWRVLPALGLRMSQLFKAMMPAAGAGFIMYAAVTATRYIFADGQGGALRLCVLVAVGALAYCAISFGLNRKGTHEVLEMLRSIATLKPTKSVAG
ncbi:Membrane protein involved in the export of O-antigen and teichoic acid [Nitrosospira sp. Nl5]|uniref:lipopolysaccharide biosynthesis protein n=1 Tax=Nitrosospira sp. Nl5 TaxID=200120 RepID=UPI0008840CF3|nr:lipopolysaccharide biosynthesis protein [Nitrosospira sp. Nl5]SCY15913.1 Membrane protein involved in the export of O-antigen and teichoic acid [Nitrosospira sp. Nl5]